MRNKDKFYKKPKGYAGFNESVYIRKTPSGFVTADETYAKGWNDAIKYQFRKGRKRNEL